MPRKRYNVKLNSIEKIEELLQEIYESASRQLNEIQNEMNKLMNSSNLGKDDTSMDEKAKYSKAIHDFVGDKDRAIKLKFDIAKFMGEIVKHNGDLNDMANDPAMSKKFGPSSLNWERLKTEMDGLDDGPSSTTYNIK